MVIGICTPGTKSIERFLAAFLWAALAFTFEGSGDTWFSVCLTQDIGIVLQ